MKYLKRLAWDSDFFGYKVGEIFVDGLKEDALASALHEAKEQGYHLLYAKIFFDNLKLNELMLQQGGFLADERVTYSLELREDDKNFKVNDGVQAYLEKEADQNLIGLALQCGEYSRFKIDKKIGEEKFVDLYRTWIKKSVSGEISEKVLVYQIDGAKVGLITLAQAGDCGTLGLIGVDGDFRGRKIGQQLVVAAKRYFAEKNLPKLVVSTQGKNISACRFYEKCGFSVVARKNIYHFWL